MLEIFNTTNVILLVALVAMVALYIWQQTKKWE
jgi:hypothetical protein